MGKSKHHKAGTKSRPVSTNGKVTDLLNRVREVLQPAAPPSSVDKQLVALAVVAKVPDATATLNPNDLGIETVWEEEPPTTNPMAGLDSPIIQPKPSDPIETLQEDLASGTDNPTFGNIIDKETHSTFENAGTKLTPGAQPGRSLPNNIKPTISIPLKPTSSGSPTSSIDTDPSVKVDKARLGDRPLAWNELWAAWPILSLEEIKGARESRQPLDVFWWRDGLLLIHPPQRTASYRMSPCQIAKLWMDRGMHLQIIRQIYQLRWVNDGAQRFNNILELVKSLEEHKVAQRLSLVRQTLGSGRKNKDKEDFVQTLVEYANAFMYTLPWFEEAGALNSDINNLIKLRGLCFAMIARAAGQYSCQPTTDDRIVNIGWLATKAVLWNAQRFPVSIITSTC
ncbi:hypothetical protein CcaverHIS631_0110380 [Cutaneotrichosporon cavernicola]|nr:hypothetical protein CcaverHIS631_0110380 [Cutaneotrichosporon cavernicola]BEJ03861.1 hypothetical protein CcaverHIS641_0110360 [Cutaneotrichosporon cavernicola]